MTEEVPEGFAPIEHSAEFGRLTGPFWHREDAEGGFVRAFRVAPKHVNSVGVAHGGMLATFADIVLAQAGLRAARRPIVTVRMVTDFVGPARVGDWVEGRASVVRQTRTLLFLHGALAVGGKPVLSVEAIFAIRAR